MKLSIVTTLYCSANYINEFYERVLKQAELITADFEIIFVNDGSPDTSLTAALAIARQDSHVKIIDLPRNYGHHRAMMIGLEHAVGEYIYLTDVDLEEPPESLALFWDKITQNGGDDFDVVYGTAKEKERPFLSKFLSNSFYSIFNHLSETEISPSHLVSRLMRRNYVDALLRHPEREIFIAALWAHIGFRQTGVETTKAYKGESTYTLRKRLKLAINAVTAFSSKPLIYIFYMGMTITALAILASLIILIKKFLSDEVLQGWTTIVLSIYLMSGVIVFSLGVIGIYISKIYTEVKSRPVNIVRNIYHFENTGNRVDNGKQADHE